MIAQVLRGEEIRIDGERGVDLLAGTGAIARSGERLSCAKPALKSLPLLPRVHVRPRSALFPVVVVTL